MALAPRRALLSVPSRSISSASTMRWSRASRPSTASAISPLTLPTAVEHALAAVAVAAVAQLDRLVLAGRGAGRHDGPAACAPLSSKTSTSTVGLPRESRTSRPTTSTISLTGAHLCGRARRRYRTGGARRAAPGATRDWRRAAAGGRDAPATSRTRARRPQGRRRAVGQRLSRRRSARAARRSGGASPAVAGPRRRGSRPVGVLAADAAAVLDEQRPWPRAARTISTAPSTCTHSPKNPSAKPRRGPRPGPEVAHL